MTSERRTVEGDLPDGIADRSQGYTHNPNSPDELAEQRAHFEQKQREYQQEREMVKQTIGEVQHAVEEDYEEAQHIPEHQAFIAEQRAHERTDPPHMRGGQERADEPPSPAAAQQSQERMRAAPSVSAPVTSGEVPRHAPLPVDREDADRPRE